MGHSRRSRLSALSHRSAIHARSSFLRHPTAMELAQPGHVAKLCFTDRHHGVAYFQGVESSNLPCGQETHHAHLDASLSVNVRHAQRLAIDV